MRKLTNKLFISIMTVAFAVIALGTTSFAWFTLGNTATVTAFQATVTSGEGIEISLDNTNWYSTISEALMESTLGTSTFRFQHVTSTDGAAFTTLGGGAAAGSSYISFPLYFRSIADVAPAITWTGVTLTSAGVSWSADTGFTNGEGVAILTGSASTYYAANATRIAVDGDITTIYELADTGENSVLGQKTAADLTDLVTLNNDNLGAAGSVNYFTKKTGSLPFGSEAVTVPLTITVVADLDNVPVLTLTGLANAYTGSVTIRVWIEGWDPDCFNSILRDILTIGLSFSAVAV